MDFSLNQEQRAWQGKARKFAREEIAPISLERDAILDPFEAFDWEIIKKGSKLGFRTAVVSKEEGGHGIDFVTQARCHGGTRQGRQRDFQDLQPVLEMEPSDRRRVQRGPEGALSQALSRRRYLRLRLRRTEPNGGSDDRMPPPDDIKAGLRLAGRIEGDEMVLNGDKVFIANGSIAKLFFLYVRTDPTVPISQGTTMMMVPRGTPGFRHGKVFNKSGWRFYQNAELIFENARVPMTNLIGEVNGALRRREGEVGGDIFGDLELGRQRPRHLRRRLRKGD